MSDHVELKPCPICGGAGLVQIAPNVRGLKKCPHCGGNGRVCVSSKPERLDTNSVAVKKLDTSTPCVSQNGKELDTSGSCTESLQAAPKPTYEELEKMVKPLEWKYERRAINGVVHEAFSALDYMFAAFSDDNSAYWIGRFWNNRQCGVAKTAEEIKAEAQKSLVDLVADALGVERSGK